MRVALYYPWIHLTSGAERVILELSVRSRHQWSVFTNHYDPDHTFPELKATGIREFGRISVKRNVRTTAVNCWRLLRQKLPLDNHDALIVLCEGLGDLVLLRNGSIPAICLCLTPLRAAFDPHYRDNALSRRGAVGKAAMRFGAALFSAADRILWKKYSAVVCISQEVRRRVVAARLASPQRIQVAYPGPSINQVSAGQGAVTTMGDYFLLPGRIMWTKNIELAIRAFERLRAARPDLKHFKLVIAGIVDHKSGEYYGELQRLAASSSNIEFRIHPSDSELADLYAGCRAVLFTAFNEDWGIVPLESMAFGKPVVAVNRGGPRETVVDGVTGFLEEADPEAFALRMAELAGDAGLASRLGQSGMIRVELFSWQAFTECIDTVVDRTCRTVNTPVCSVQTAHRSSARSITMEGQE